MVGLAHILKAYSLILPEPVMEQAVILLTSDILLYDLTGLNVKIPHKPLSRRI